MIGLIRLLLLILTVVGGAAFILYSIIKIALSFNNPMSRLPRIIQELRDNLKPLEETLVDIENGELKELSYNVNRAKDKRGFNPVKSGVIESIFGESFVIYSIKSFASKNIHIMMAKTSVDEYLYYITEEQTTVYINGKTTGIIDGHGVMMEMSGTSVLATIDLDPALSSFPVKLDDKNVGDVNNQLHVSTASPRVYSVLSPMEREDKNLFMAYTLLMAFRKILIV